MSQDVARGRRFAAQNNNIPRPPPLPAPRPLQRARDAASRFLGYSSRPPSPHSDRERDDEDRFTLGSSQFTRASSLGSNNATTSHRTGLEIRTISINESGSHAIIAGKDVFKTIKVEDGHCIEDLNLRTAIRSTPTSASGQPRQTYEIDIADVAWAKGDSGDYVAAATSSGKIIVYDIAHAALQAAQLHEHYRQVHNITFNPHRGSLLLSGSQDGTVRLWDLRDLRNQAQTMQSKRKFAGQSEGVRDVKWSPTEGYDFAFGTENGEIQRWDIRNLKVAKLRVPAHGLACNTVDWHPDGKHILSAGSDKTVRVFDVSNSRPKKASWEIKTPYPVMLARWRPSCVSAMPRDNGAQQCTQIVTAYDRIHPITHVWDFRRPYLPFRELCPHPAEAPRDLLWHSQDLLWTVGDKTFLQTDIQHTPKVIDRCNLQTLSASPRGEITLITQRRRDRRMPKSQSVPTLHPRTNSSLSTSPESAFLSRSWADDSLDQSFLSVLPFKRSDRSNSKSRVHNASGSSSFNGNQSITIKLDDILLNRKSFRPQQAACRGRLPSHNDHHLVSFLAKHSRLQISTTDDDGGEFIQTVEEAFRANQEYASSTGLYQSAQTWKMISFCTVTHLRERLALRQRQLKEKSSPSPFQNPIATSIETLTSRLVAQHLKSPTHSPGTMRPVSTIAQQLAMPESTSNVPTPLARPSSRGPLPPLQSNSQRPLLPDPDKGESIALPPSLTRQGALVSSSPEESAPKGRRLTAGNLKDLQKLESARETDRIDMVKRWSTQPKNPLSLDPVDADGVRIPPAKLEHHGSGESFQFLEESTGSRGSSFPASLESRGSPTHNMVSAHPSRPSGVVRTTSYDTAITDTADPTHMVQSMFFEGSGTLANSAAQTKENSGNTSLEASDENLRKPAKHLIDSTDFAFNSGETDPGSGQRSRKVEPSIEILSAALKRADVFTPRADANGTPHEDPQKRNPGQILKSVTLEPEVHSPIDSVMDEEEQDLELSKPWTLIELLQQLLHHYTAAQPYPQMASLLVLLLGPLLPRTHPLPASDTQRTISSYVDYFLSQMSWDAHDLPLLVKTSFEQPLKAGIHPLQIESILSTYHEQLLAFHLHDEAASLRKLAYPAYPAVYEDFVRDNTIKLMCGHCHHPLDDAAARCRRCRSADHSDRRHACPVCWEASSPFAPAGVAGTLLSACLLCGHSGHAACLRAWFSESGGDGCPVEGCLCDCVAGSWRDERAGLAAAVEGAKIGPETMTVRSDEWRARESRAVEQARTLV